MTPAAIERAARIAATADSGHRGRGQIYPGFDRVAPLVDYLIAAPNSQPLAGIHDRFAASKPFTSSTAFA